MKKTAKVDARIRVIDPYPLLACCEPTEDIIHVARTVAGRKHVIKGVPGREIDVVIADDVFCPHSPRDKLVLELVRKTGKFDGATRDRLYFRRLPGHQCQGLPVMDIDVRLTDASVNITIGDGYWSRSYRRLRYIEDGEYGTLARIIKWHWRRWYTHLTDEGEINALADAWAAEVESKRSDWTLSEFNRSAARRLYRFSKECGWVKLDTRQRERLHARTMWVSAAWYAEALAAWHGDPTGTGEATRRGTWENEEAEGENELY